MAEYLRFQLNTPPDVCLTSLVGVAGAYIMKLRFQQKVKKSSSLLALVDSQVHRRSVRSNYDQVSEMMDNINYLFYLGANCDVADLPDYSILTRPKSKSGLKPDSSSENLMGLLREMPRSSAAVILRLRCKMFKVKANQANGDDVNCPECGVLEDEKHVLEDCPRFAVVRQKYSTEETRYGNVYSDDPGILLKMADFADKIENAILLNG